MAKKRPDYIKCIEHTRESKEKLTWCGRRVEVWDFTFTSIDHAAYSNMDGDRLLPCPKCVKAICYHLEHNAAEPGYKKYSG